MDEMLADDYDLDRWVECDEDGTWHNLLQGYEVERKYVNRGSTEQYLCSIWDLAGTRPGELTYEDVEEAARDLPGSTSTCVFHFIS